MSFPPGSKHRAYFWAKSNLRRPPESQGTKPALRGGKYHFPVGKYGDGVALRPFGRPSAGQPLGHQVWRRKLPSFRAAENGLEPAVPDVTVSNERVCSYQRCPSPTNL